jgi:hypothetical protein
MSLRLNSSQQRLEGSGLVPQGPWTSATYGRANGIVTVTSIAHRLNDQDRVYIKFGEDALLRTIPEGQQLINVIDDDTFTILGTGQNFIEAATSCSYRLVRSFVLNATDSMAFTVGTGANEDDAVFINKGPTGNIRVGINNTNPEFDLDVEGQIRTTRSIISDTAQIRNLDVTNQFVTKGLDLRGPNLINFEETDPTASDFGTIYYPTADNPPRQTQNNRIATTKFVYDVATADNGGRVYVSSVPGIGDDDNDGRSAAKPVRTIKKAAQIAYSLQQDTEVPEYVSIICSGGDYVEDNPISLPFNCSLIGDNLRRVILRPLNQDRHMIKASNETYASGVVFRDHLDNTGSPDWTWKYAYVFDDKQRLYYEPDLEPFSFSPGLGNQGRNIFAITFENHTGDNTTLLVGYAVEGGSSSSRGIIESVVFTGPVASPYSSGTIQVLMSDDQSTFLLAEKLYYADIYANIVKTGASPSDSLDVSDRESQRPETEVIKHQRYQHVISSETEILRFDGTDLTNVIDTTDNRITIPLHRLYTGAKVIYKVQNEFGAAVEGLNDNTTYFVRVINENTIELYDTWLDATSLQTTTGIRNLSDEGAGDEHTLFTSRISVNDDTIYFPNHGLFTGNGVYYRASKAGGIGGLNDNSLIFIYRIDSHHFKLANTQADATNKNIAGEDAPVILPLTYEGIGYQRFEKALNVVDIASVTTDVATQQEYNGIIFAVTGASRVIEGINFVGHDYEVGQEVHVYGMPYTALSFGSGASATYTQTANQITVTVSNTDPTVMNVLWPNLKTLGPVGGKGVGVRMVFDDAGNTGHINKSFHIATYQDGTLAQTQSDFGAYLGSPSNLGAGVARYNSSTNEVYFILRAVDSATRSGNVTVFDNLGDFNGRKYVTHRIERADGYSLQFVTRGSCSRLAVALDPSGDQQVCSATNYALMSLRNSPYAFDKVEFGANIQESAKQRDAAETINNNLNFIAEESYAYVKSQYNAGTNTSFSRTGSYTCVGNVMTVVAPRGHGVFAKSSYAFNFSGATQDGAYIVDDCADHRTFTIILPSASTDSGTVTITVPAPWQTPNSVPPVDRNGDGTSMILANKQLIAQEAVARMLLNNPTFNIPTGNQACIDDAIDFLEAMAYNLAYGGNDQVYDAAKYYVQGAHVVGEEDESVEVFEEARDLAIQAMRNETISIQGSHGLTQIKDFTITPDSAQSGVGDRFGDARNLIYNNKQFIAEIAVGRMMANIPYEIVDSRHMDAHDLIIANVDFIAAEAYEVELAADPTLTTPTGDPQDCIDDVADVLRAIAFNVQHGSNNQVWDAANLYVGTPHLDGEEAKSIAIMNHARDIAKLVITNRTHTKLGIHDFDQVFDTTITHDQSAAGGAYSAADCANVQSTIDTLFGIVTDAIQNDTLAGVTKTTPAPFSVPTGNQACIDDIINILEVTSWNTAMGGNDFTYDAAQLYISGAHVAGEENHSIYAFRQARDIAIECFQNELVSVGGYTNLTQYRDLTITQDTGLPICANVIAAFTALMNIVEVAVDTNSLSTVTRTLSYANRCSDTAAAITSLTAIVTDAIGSTGSPGNLNGVTRTYPVGDQQCIDDVYHVLRSWMYDMRYGGNSKTIEAARKYLQGTSINYVTNEVPQTREVYEKAKDMSILAIRNQLPQGNFSQIAPFHNASTTVDSNQPECGASINFLTGLYTILDDALTTAGTSLSSVTLTEPSSLLRDDSGLKRVPMLSDNLDLPVIEASPYIQNASLISFLGASGAEIDGAKVATPNVPRPGVFLDGNGIERPTFPPQGKSMVANAFTIISVNGGVGYNILNDGYTQLVSVFVIFGGDGVIVQSGGYASLTNSASNFGTRALKATGYRAEAYEFDVGTVTQVRNQTDNNGAQTGRQIIEVGGPMTNFPVEDYIIKFDGFVNSDPSKEYFILGTEKLSGSIGTQITANITTNDGLGLDLIRTSDNTNVSFQNGNLDLLNNAVIRLHRPSVCNSSSHTWEYVGAGDTYNALPQNGGVGIPANEAVEEAYGQVYTSGTNEFGDFKVGDFVTIFNRTGSISFVGTVSISELSSIKIVGGSITVTGFSDSDELGGAFASDSLLPTQAAVKDYITNKLGPYLNQPYSTNAVPSALVQLTTSGKINIEQIPALRPFNITSVTSTAERLAIEDASAGDIAIETTSTSFQVAPSSVDIVNNVITIPSHGLNTGDILTYFQGTSNIGNLADGANYYVIQHAVGANTTDYIKLATSLADAQAGTERNLTSQGTGTHVLRTEGAAISYILENDLDTMFAAFTPNSQYVFNNNSLLVGSQTTAQVIVTNYEGGVVRDILIDDPGSGYATAPGITIGAPPSGVQATATCTITNGQIASVTITNPGSGYYTAPTVSFTGAPTGGTTATAQGNAARIEARLYVDLANNIKLSDIDFLLDEANVTVASGVYTHDTFDITITETNHGFSQGDTVYLEFTSGSSTSGFYAIDTIVNANEYTVVAQTALLTSGNYNRKRIVDLTRVVNTSASNAQNWTQLSSTNIDASNIVAGVIDPQRLADTGVANSFTFLRGDASFQYAVQSIKFTTADVLVGESSIQDNSYIERVDIINPGSGYTVGTYQNIPMVGGNVQISESGVARATYTVSDVVTGGIIDSVSNLNFVPGSYTPNSTFDVAASNTDGAGLGVQIRFLTDAVGDISVDIILDGGSGYSGGDTLEFDGPLFGGTVQQGVTLTVSTLTSSTTFGAISSVSVVTPGTGYNSDFTLTIPSELGQPAVAGSLTAVKGTLSRYYGNTSIDLLKANNLTPTTLQAGGSVFGNYGIAKFRKPAAEQALANQDLGGFVITVNGEVTIDQGPGSKLNADKLDGNEGSFYQNATNLTEGILDPQRLANTTYNISISGTADYSNTLFCETTAPSSANASLVSAANVGTQLALRSNSVTGIPTDAGGTRAGILTFRRSATGNSVAQLAFSATDNLYIRGNSDTGTVYGQWAKVWHSENDGAPDPNDPRRGTLPGPDADYLDGKQGLWFQSGYNINDQRTSGVIGDTALPELLGRNKYFADNLYLVASSETYELYIPDYFASTGTAPIGNLSNNGVYTLYSDEAAVNNIGTISVLANGISEVNDSTTGSVYTLVRGTINFVGAFGNKDIKVFGPNPGTKWTVTSSNLLTTGASQVFAMSNTANGALLEIGRTNVVATPTIDFRSGALAADYDVRFEVSGGTAQDGQGVLELKTSSFTLNGNTVWHSGNDGATSQLDAHYVDGYIQSATNTANALVRRDASSNIFVSDITADQGIFANTGESILQLADGNGINLGKAGTNNLSIRGRQDTNSGYVQFGNDGKSLGFNGTHLSYGTIYFRNDRIGIGDSDPAQSLTSTGNAVFGTATRSANTFVRALAGDSNQAGFEAYGNSQGTGYLFVGQNSAYGGGIAYNGDNSPASFGSEQGDDITFYRRDNGTDTRVMKYRYDDSTVHFFGQIRSRVATGTAPVSTDSTTVCTNLNADLLDGYQATNLPYLSSQVNTWINDAGGQPRFYFSNNSHTYLRTGDDFFFRNDSDQTFASWDNGGRCHFHEPGSNSIQTTYRVQITGDNGLNINASEGLSSGQKSTVLRASGDKQYLDSYGIIKRNRQNIGESITINNGDSCGSFGPITINSGVTIQVASGGAWVIL